jgi:hypothetical protein
MVRESWWYGFKEPFVCVVLALSLVLNGCQLYQATKYHRIVEAELQRLESIIGDALNLLDDNLSITQTEYTK